MTETQSSSASAVSAPPPSRMATRGLVAEGLIIILGVAIIAASQLWGHLLFHCLAELAGICVAASSFVIAWHTRRLNENPTIAVLGIAYLFVAILDLFHMLAYVGMGVFPGYHFAASQLWVVASALEAASLLLFTYIGLAKGRTLAVLFILAGLYTMAAIAAVFVFRISPASYAEGLGQTPFRIGAGIGIMLILIAATLSLWVRRAPYPRDVHIRLQLSIGAAFLSELAFTVSSSNHAWVNMSGHILKILSFYFVAKAVINTGLERPQSLLSPRAGEKNRQPTPSDTTQSSFISVLSHDLKSPVGGIQAAAAFLSKNHGSLEKDELDEMLATIAATAASTLTLVENVVGWARCQSGAMVPRLALLDGEKALRRQILLLAEAAKSKSVSIDVEVSATGSLLSDDSMLSAILRNLLQNAIKFSHIGGRIATRVSIQGNSCVFVVSDSGVGMGPETIERLFRIDGRLRSVGTAGEKGNGFGLILSQEYARKLGGAIEVESEIGRGSTFRLILPAG